MTSVHPGLQPSPALAEAGVRLEHDAFTNAAAHSLRAAAKLQAENGWLPSWCLTDPERPLLHTLAYAIGGFLEGGRVLGDPHLVNRAERAARHPLKRSGQMVGCPVATGQTGRLPCAGPV